MGREKTGKTNAMRILDKKKIPYQMHLYPCKEFVDGVQIAQIVGQPVDQVFKTLVTRGNPGDYFVFVIPVSAELDLKKAAAAAGQKALSMLPVKEIYAITGYIRGGCTAIGMKKQFSTFVDKSAENLDTMLVSGGKLGVQLELEPTAYLTANRGCYADLKAE